MADQMRARRVLTDQPGGTTYAAPQFTAAMLKEEPKKVSFQQRLPNMALRKGADALTKDCQTLLHQGKMPAMVAEDAAVLVGDIVKRKEHQK